jgi:hypothetical protein
MNEQETILDFFINKKVHVQNDGYVITGKLRSYELSDKTTHLPCILVLEVPCGRAILRGD